MRGLRRARVDEVQPARATVRPSRFRALAVIAALLLVLSACSSTVAGRAVIDTSGGATPLTPVTSAVEPAPVPAGLEQFYGQQLQWGSCSDFATTDQQSRYYRSGALQCARLTVPLRYDEPAGPTITLAVVRAPATDSASRIGSLMFNPGGPGASGVDIVAQLVAFGVTSVKDLNRSFDLVGFDPRGVGASDPAIRCRTDAERDADRATTLRSRTPEEIAAANAFAQEFAQGCASLSSSSSVTGDEFLPQVGTVNVARDLDVLRAAVGDQRLNYVGFSYGTAIGTQYAALFPANVRAMILDGAVDPNADAVGDSLGQAEGFQKAFDAFATWCARRPDCVLGSDPAQSTAVFQQLVRPLLDTPAKLSDGRVLTFDDATTGVAAALYSEALWPSLASALLDLSRGKGDALMALADSYDGRDASGKYVGTLDAFAVIRCADSGDTADSFDEADAQKIAAAAPFFDSGDPVVVGDDPCKYLPPSESKLAPLGDLTGLPTTVVISTTGDPATPYESGVDLAKALDSRLVTVNGNSHTAFLNTGNSCVDQLGTRYLVSLQLPEPDTTC